MKKIWYKSFICLIGLFLIAMQTQVENPDGKALYLKYCKSCHGKTASRQNKRIPSLLNSQKSEDEKREVILKGKEKMPPFETVLSEAQIQAIVGYIDELSP